GAVLGQRAVAIDPAETAGELHDRLAALGPDAIEAVLDAFARDRLEPREQDERHATPAPKLRKADGTVRFDQSADAVRCRIHGLTPWPGCTVRLGVNRLKLLRVETVAATGAEPGVIREGGVVTCAEGGVRMIEVQPPGGRPMRFEDYLRGHPISPEERMEPV
ncbi:MAG: methionyl-tRNA formyltransferase, partial [Phycisphaerae bacterium]|nr:methionyl-tRNA formyltransferase [Phycisphaerae bacterium]